MKRLLYIGLALLIMLGIGVRIYSRYKEPQAKSAIDSMEDVSQNSAFDQIPAEYWY